MKTPYTILDAGLPYVLLVLGHASTHAAKRAVATSNPYFAKHGKGGNIVITLGGITTAKTVVVVDCLAPSLNPQS